MSEEQAAQAKPNLKINMVQVLDMGCGILHQLFIRESVNKSKALLKDLKQGKKISVGALTLTPKDKDGKAEALAPLDIPLSIRLDYSEYRGPGFSHPVFIEALNGMLHQIVTAMRAKKDLNILTSESGSMLVHKPGVVQLDGQFNVMLLALEPSANNSMVMKLMFVDPDQYESVRREEK